MSSGIEQIHRGIAASAGISMSPLRVVDHTHLAPEIYEITAEQVAHEQKRFLAAIERTHNQLTELKDKLVGFTEDSSANTETEIFEAHIMLLEDRTVLKKVKDLIVSRQQNAEACFYAAMQNYLEIMRRISDSYLRERTADIEDVMVRVLNNFTESNDNVHYLADYEHILVTTDLSPSDTAGLDRKFVKGFVTEHGNVNSHTAILARALGIPAVVGLATSVLDLAMHAPAIVDGYSGLLIICPSAETYAKYEGLQAKHRELNARLLIGRNDDTNTLDGHHVCVSSNLELIQELDEISHSGAKGIGLYRTEFLLLNDHGGELPTENEQAEAYGRVVKAMSPHQVIIRTLDSGGDKLPFEKMLEPEANPFLGWRGIRVSLDRPEMFQAQISAILRASAFGKTAVMFPLVSGLYEVKKGKEMILRCMDDLHSKGVAFDEKLAVGVMMEVPSAAICADLIAPYVDFFSIGTNDLIQYTVAVDRGNAHVVDLYRSTHPAVVRLMKNIITAGKDHGIWTGVCGEMAGDIRLTPLLLGLGVSELSVSHLQVPRVGHAIRALQLDRCESMAIEALKCSHSNEIMELSEAIAHQSYADLF